MPNYCDNLFRVKGKATDVNDFLMQNTTVSMPHYTTQNGEYPLEIVLDFEKILPTPKKENGEDIDDWFNWRMKNWGTKWDICDTHYFTVAIVPDRKGEVELTTSFSTAWTPADKLYKHLAEKYKDTSLEFYAEYFEGGCAFAGDVTYKDGKCAKKNYYEYKENNLKNNIKYYAYLIEKEHESLEWMEDQIHEHMEDNDIDDEEIEITIAEFNVYCKRNKFKKAAELYLSKVSC